MASKKPLNSGPTEKKKERKRKKKKKKLVKLKKLMFLVVVVVVVELGKGQDMEVIAEILAEVVEIHLEAEEVLEVLLI